MNEVRIDRERCKGCELCVEFCPRGVIVMSSSLNRKGLRFAQVLRHLDCTGCAQCATVCPDAAIEILRHAFDAAPAESRRI